MGSVVVAGGGMVGLAAAVMMARDGHRVTVLESDPDGAPAAPERAWASWRRRGVAQFHQPHNLFARFRVVCDEELPGVTARLVAAGCVWVDLLDPPPPTLTDRLPRPGDERLRSVTGRRPVVEAVFAALAEEQAGVTVQRGMTVAGLLTGPSAIDGVPHVTGVRTTAGDDLPADLVVDATGRRAVPEYWLGAIGARPPLVAAEEHGFAYYTRYFTGARPRRVGPALAVLGSVSLATIDADNDTWSVTVFGLSGDTPIRALRDPAAFHRVVRACPLHAHWLDGRPITGVLPMAGILDRIRRFVVDGRPVVTGYVAVGDSWACTNPSAGRGLSVGLVQAQLLRHAVRAHLDRPGELALAYDAATERVATPFYRAQVAADRSRTAEMAAVAAGDIPPPRDPVAVSFSNAAAYDPDAYRGLAETAACLSQPDEVLARPAVRAAMAAYGDHDGFPPAPGPDRTDLLRLLSSR